MYAWAYSEDPEFWNTGFDSVTDCTEDAMNYDPETDEIFVCETEPIDVYGEFDTEYFIESLENYCEIEVDVTDEELSELKAAVENVMNEWISKYSIGSNNFRIKDIMKVNMKEGK